MREYHMTRLCVCCRKRKAVMWTGHVIVKEDGDTAGAGWCNGCRKMADAPLRYDRGLVGYWKTDKFRRDM